MRERRGNQDQKNERFRRELFKLFEPDKSNPIVRPIDSILMQLGEAVAVWSQWSPAVAVAMSNKKSRLCDPETDHVTLK